MKNKSRARNTQVPGYVRSLVFVAQVERGGISFNKMIRADMILVRCPQRRLYSRAVDFYFPDERAVVSVYTICCLVPFPSPRNKIELC